MRPILKFFAIKLDLLVCFLIHHLNLHNLTSHLTAYSAAIISRRYLILFKFFYFYFENNSAGHTVCYTLL